MRLLIRGGQVVDPGRRNEICDIVLADGVVQAILPAGDGPQTDAGDFDRVVDAAGWLVAPGFIDMHVHLREPGHEYKETIETGCRAAVAGGFTAVCCMPNTDPVNDCRSVTEYILQKAADCGLAKVYPVAAISPGLKGQGLCEFADLKDAGVVAVTDDGMPVSDGQLMRRALEYAKGHDLLVMSHCEELSLAEGGAMNEGETATRMGVAGIPNAAESLMVMREIALSELTGTAVHIAHVSTAESVRAIRAAKQRGAAVSAETAPHYFSLTDQAVEGYKTHAKMNPPLRSENDRQAILKGLVDGTLDAIATDHAPHSSIEKDVEFDRAANGIIGLETAVPLSLSLVRDNILSMEQMVALLSTQPAKILNLPEGIQIGQAADLTLIDCQRKWTVDAVRLQSKSPNTPFEGWEMTGQVMMTLVDGNIVWSQTDRL